MTDRRRPPVGGWEGARAQERDEQWRRYQEADEYDLRDDSSARGERQQYTGRRVKTDKVAQIRRTHALTDDELTPPTKPARHQPPFARQRASTQASWSPRPQGERSVRRPDTFSSPRPSGRVRDFFGDEDE
jgi:hypothetical protein